MVLGPRSARAVVAAAASLCAVADGTPRTNHVYIKLYKCASSTSGGVARRIANHFGLFHVRDGASKLSDEFIADSQEPRVFANHCPRVELENFTNYKNLELEVFPMWSMVRDPAERVLSHYYMHTAEKDARHGRSRIIEHASKAPNFMFDFLRPARCGETDVACVIDAYDFLGAVELYDESMIQLAEVVDVPLQTVLYSRAKVSAESDDSVKVNRGVDAQADDVRAYFNSAEWLDANALDYELWWEVVRRVTAKAQDAERQAKLEEYRSMLNRTEEACSNYGKKDVESMSYWRDNGEHFVCMDLLFGS